MAGAAQAWTSIGRRSLRVLSWIRSDTPNIASLAALSRIVQELTKRYLFLPSQGREIPQRLTSSTSAAFRSCAGIELPRESAPRLSLLLSSYMVMGRDQCKTRTLSMPPHDIHSLQPPERYSTRAMLIIVWIGSVAPEHGCPTLQHCLLDAVGW